MSHKEIAVKMVLDRWSSSIKSFGSLINELSDEQLHREVAPGKNRGIYLLGHLIAVHDDMLPILGLGERHCPGLYDPYVKAPDKTVELKETVAELRGIWFGQCNQLEQKFAKLSPLQWFEKHTIVAEADFTKEPHRNKLNVVLNRTTHLQYHMGQLQLLK